MIRSLLTLLPEARLPSIEDEIWDLMLRYQHSRIEQHYIPNLRSSLKECDNLFHANVNGNFAAALSQVSDLRKLTFEAVGTGQRVTVKYSKLVKKAHDLRMMKTVQELLQNSPHAASKTKMFWDNICFLGRLRVAFEKFTKIAVVLPSFRKVAITLVPRDVALEHALQGAITLKQVFAHLNIPLNEANIKAVVDPKWTVPRVEKEFTARQKQKLNVHAEVQMILFLSQNPEPFEDMFPYLGCSKYSCFMCSHFLKAYGKLATRGCHGRLFKPWTVPETPALATGQPGRIAKAVIQLQKDLKNELKSGIQKKMAHVKTSVVGGSSVFTANHSNSERRRNELDQRRIQVEQGRVAEMFKRLALEDQASDISSQRSGNNQGVAGENNYLDPCDVCSQMTSRRCSICNKDSYCSKSCEEKRSGSHIFTCTKRAITTADYLYRSIAMDELPDEEQVLEDFRFHHFTSFADKCKLLGLYKGLYLFEVPVEDVHKWQVEGSLVANIKKHFYGMPEHARGGYFPWFLNHTDIFNRVITKKEAEENIVATFYDQSRMYLDEEDRHVKPNQLKPDAKSQAYQLLAANLHMAGPNPVEENWFAFGFCTCYRERQERSLGGLYGKLLVGNNLFSDVHKMAGIFFSQWKMETATFNEFWHAHESGKLIQLMDSKGFKADRKQFPFLEEFLSVSPSGPQPSVWSLKQFLAIEQPAKYPPIPAVGFDYGFTNCETFEETCILMEIYKRLLLKANPLDLHKACLAGRLFEFAGKFDKMEEGHRRLMRNFYPL